MISNRAYLFFARLWFVVTNGQEESRLYCSHTLFCGPKMNSCIWQFRAYEEESLDYLHMREGLVEDSPLVGGWDSSVSKKDAYESLR